jgi:hypothetical protein
VCDGDGPDGPIFTEAIDVANGSIAFSLDPERRRRGMGREMAGVVMRRPGARAGTAVLGWDRAGESRVVKLSRRGRGSFDRDPSSGR